MPSPDPGAPDLGSEPLPTSRGRELRWSWLGRRPYGATWRLQEEIRRLLQAGKGPERLLLLEHDPVFTLGRNASEDDVLADRGWLESRGVEVHESNRGGQVTYHGPGQLVGYPIVDLRPDRRDVGRYVRDLQEALIRTLGEIGIEARRKDGKDFIGVWVGDAKIASIGVHLARWVAIHGFALNVRTELAHFGGIVACGLDDVAMTSVEAVAGGAPSPADLAPLLSRHLSEILERRLTLETRLDEAEIAAEAAKIPVKKPRRAPRVGR
ncbi:MAG: lipoyl(octanoyl) transferase LipB [Acidobacteriota bacterium]